MATVGTSSFPIVNAYTTGMKTEIKIRDENKISKLYSKYLAPICNTWLLNQSVDTLFIICMLFCKIELQMLVQTCLWQSISAWERQPFCLDYYLIL